MAPGPGILWAEAVGGLTTGGDVSRGRAPGEVGEGVKTLSSSESMVCSLSLSPSLASMSRLKGLLSLSCSTSWRGNEGRSLLQAK